MGLLRAWALKATSVNPGDPVGMLSPVTARRVHRKAMEPRPGAAALPGAPSRTTGLARGPSYPQDPGVSSLEPLKAHLSAAGRPGPSRTTAPDHSWGPAWCVAASQRPGFFAGSLCGLAVEMRLAVISQASPILPNPLCFILILHVSANLQ